MTGDSRFVRECGDVQELLDVLDLDGVEDLEDLRMLLFLRPVDLTSRRGIPAGSRSSSSDAGALDTELDLLFDDVRTCPFRAHRDDGGVHRPMDLRAGSSTRRRPVVGPDPGSIWHRRC